MTHITRIQSSRRNVLKGAGALIVSSFAMPPIVTRVAAQAIAAGKPALLPTELDSFIAVLPDGKVNVFFGKMDMGQGLDTAIAQIAADELDVNIDRVSVIMCDTAVCVDQGGASGSTGLKEGAIPIRNAAAEARRVLTEMASQKLGVAPAQLTVADGVVSGGGKSVSYAELIGGKYFHTTLEWNQRYGNNLSAQGKAKPKPAEQYKYVGTSIPGREVAGKVFGKTAYVTDMRRPNMLHGRMIRPPVAGATPISVDEASLKDIPGAKVVRVDNLIAVVADDEWSAVKASQAVAVKWSDAKPPFPSMDSIYDHIRKAPTVVESAGAAFGSISKVDEGPIDAALAAAPRVVEREYEHPFHSHACMGPACALVEIANGKATVWTGSQKAHEARTGVAAIIGMNTNDVHGIWMPGPGSYGRNDAGDAALDAAVLAKATGRPVRVQYMRHEGTGWDPKAPACVVQMKAGLDAAGNVIAYKYKARGFSAWDVSPRETDPADTLAGQLTSAPPKPRHNYGVPSESYGFAAKYAYWQTVPPLLDRASPMRTSHFRDPQGPQIQFASESFIDELALEARMDPVEFRLKYVRDPRDAAVIKAAAEKAGWERRVGARQKTAGRTLTGQGIAYASRAGSTVATIAEVEIDPTTGRVWPRKFTVAHECGFIVNPGGLKKTVEGNIVMAASRALFEEVRWDNENVTSVDWATYPILEIGDAPEEIDVVLIDRRDLPPSGAGEPSTRQVAAAIANAIFDATGKRLRRVPFSPDRVKSLLG
jgi:CO/xanthine dehydrogenase Mo-binding subunit